MAWFWVAAATFPLHRQIGQERLGLGFGGEEVCARPDAVERDESDDPLHIGSLGVNGVVVQTERSLIRRKGQNSRKPRQCMASLINVLRLRVTIEFTRPPPNYSTKEKGYAIHRS